MDGLELAKKMSNRLSEHNLWVEVLASSFNFLNSEKGVSFEDLEEAIGYGLTEWDV